MSWIKIIWFVLQYAPTVIAIIKDVFEEIEKVPAPEKPTVKREVKEGVKESRRKRDFRPFERLRAMRR